jgi:hypothetical protein
MGIRDGVHDLLSGSEVYIDFGYHPGKDQNGPKNLNWHRQNYDNPMLALLAEER